METITPVQPAANAASNDPYEWQATNIPGTGPVPTVTPDAAKDAAKDAGNAAGRAAAEAVASIAKTDILLTAFAVGAVCVAAYALTRRDR